MAFEDWVDRFAVWKGFHPDLQTLLIYGIGITVYTALVFAFYVNISRRDPLHGKTLEGWWGKAKHAGETILTFPVLAFGYFTLLSLALFLMAKPERATGDILLLSMACVMGVRFCAHLAQSMAVDLAKLLPLSLLAVVIVDPGYLSITGVFTRLGQGAELLPVLVQYFALFILTEAGLRGVRALFPGAGKLAQKVDHHRRLSKKAMLRDVAHEHEGSGLFKRHHHHDHAPRDATTSKGFLTLDENMSGKPGARQGLGPAIKHEMKQARPEGHVQAPTPKAGPGGKGGGFARF